MTKRLPAVITMTIVLALAGCGGSSAGKHEAKAIATAPPVDGGHYETPQALIAAMEKVGVTCVGYTETAGAIGAVSRGSCNIDNVEQVVSIYATTADATGQPEVLYDTAGGLLDVDMVVGQNWTINSDNPGLSQKVAAAIGGKVVHIAKK